MIAAVTCRSTRRPVTVLVLWLAIVVGCFTVGVGVFDRLVSEVGAVPGLAVALDASIVRMLLVPATMTLFGRYNWWAPGPLRRLHGRVFRAESPAGAPRPAEDRHRLSTPS